MKQNGANTNALGAKVQVFTPAGIVTQEAFPVHGFQSSMQGPLHFGLPSSHVDSLVVRWPDGAMQTEKKITANGPITITYKSGGKLFQKPMLPKTVFSKSALVVPFRHVQEDVNDFKVQPLLPNMLSYGGPHVAKGDVNGDGLEDIFVCGGKGQAGALLLQKEGGFSPSEQKAFEEDAGSEDADALFFDADGDGDLDLYVASGGYQFDADDALLQDRLYINDAGVFKKSKDAVPKEGVSGSCVRAADWDNDGDLDLFVGSRVVPGRYPEAPPSMLLQNDGHGHFKNVPAEVAPEFLQLGMVTDAQWLDVNGDKKPELIVCGEWMAIRCFSMRGGKLIDVSKNHFEDLLNGWWNRLAAADLDGDGDLDLVAGNWGQNSQLKASADSPLQLYYGDFDKNGFIDPLLDCYVQGVSYPIATRDELTDQMTSLRQKFPTYDSYSDARMQDVLSPAQLDSATVLKATELSTVWFENKAGRFIKHALPVQADYAPVYAIAIADFNKDGYPDILLGGGVEKARLKIGKLDAGYGVLLAGTGNGNFSYVPQLPAGLVQRGCIRDLAPLRTNKGNVVLMAVNNEAPQLYNY